MLLRVSWVLFLVSMVLPAVHSVALSAGRATYGWELALSLPLAILNPLVLTHPLIWIYVTVLWSVNLTIIMSERLYRRALDARLSIGFFKVLTLGILCALSVAAGQPSLIGVDVERVMIGYYCWVASLIVAGVALALARAAGEARPIAPV
jgi:hypothetical protein